MPETFLHLSLVYLLTLLGSIVCSIAAGILSMKHLAAARKMDRISLDAYFEGRFVALFGLFFFYRYSILLAASVATCDLVIFYGMRPEKSWLMLVFCWAFTLCGLHFCSYMIDAFWGDPPN